MDTSKVAILVKRASLEYERMANPQLAEHGLTEAQYKVLSYLYTAEGEPVRTVDLERAFSLTHPTAIGLLDQLEFKGYLTRESNPADARSRVIVLSEKALDRREELEGLGAELDGAFTVGLTPKERDRLVALLGKLLETQGR